MKSFLSSSEPTAPQYSGEWLRQMVELSLPRLDTSATRSWRRHVETENGAYEYGAVLEAYDNLTRHQMLRAESFLERYPLNPLTASTLARAAYDASLYGDQYLNNTFLMFDHVNELVRASRYSVFANPVLDTYRVISGFKEDVSNLPELEQQGRITAAQFTMGVVRSGSNDYRLLSIDRSDSNGGPEETIRLSDAALRKALYRSPGKAEEFLTIKDDHPEISVSAMIEMVEGAGTKSLTLGVL